MANLIDVVPTLLALQGLDIPRAMQGQPLPTVTNTPPRDATFAECGAGGPPFRMSDLECMAKFWGRRTLIDSPLALRPKVGAKWCVPVNGSTSMIPKDQDELYDLVNDPWSW